MLNLKLPTDTRWVDLTEKSLEEILTDHAWCEQKATTNCISLISSYSDLEDLVARVAPVVSEEWGHFRMVLAELNKRGMKLGPQRKDIYVNRLISQQIKGGSYEDRLMEKLLTCAMIEARSCERFRLLSLHLSDPDLKAFYHKFMVSEAGHYRMFIDLAKQYCDSKRVAERWEEMLQQEAQIMQDLDLRGDRIH